MSYTGKLNPQIHHQKTKLLILALLSVAVAVYISSILALTNQGFNGPALGALGLLWVCIVWAAVSIRTSITAGTYYLLVLLIVLAPNLTISSELPQIRADQLLLLCLSPWILMRRARLVSIVDVFLLVHALSIVLSLTVGSAIVGKPPLLQDWFELLKPFFWWLMLSFGMAIRWRRQWREWAIWMALLAGAFVFLLTVAQRYDMFAVNTWLSPLYISYSGHLTAITYRVFGSFPNADELGLFMAAEACIALALLIFGGYKKSVRFALVLYLLCTVTSVALSGTRLGVVAISLGIFLVFLVWLWRRSPVKLLPITAAILSPLVLLILAMAIAQIADSTAARWGTSGDVYAQGNPVELMLYRFSSVTNDASAVRRFSDWESAWDLIMQSPLVGTGPSKGIDEIRYFHSDYLLLLRRYGFIGLFVFLLVYFFAAYHALTWPPGDSGGAESTSNKREHFLIGMAILTTLLVFGLGALVIQVFISFQLTAFFWWLVGLAYWLGGPAHVGHKVCSDPGHRLRHLPGVTL